MWDYLITGFESLVNLIRSATCMLRDRIDTFTSTRVTRRVVNQPISRWLVADQSCRSESEMYFDPFAPIGIAPSMAWLIEDSRLVSAYWTREKWLQSACSVYRVKRNESTSIHIFPVTWVFFCVFNFLRMLLVNCNRQQEFNDSVGGNRLQVSTSAPHELSSLICNASRPSSVF